MKLILLILTVIKLLSSSKGININPSSCSESFCAEYVAAKPCKPLPENCKIQNSTHNGIIVPSPVPCNCCEACLENIAEGEPCSLGGIGSSVPDSICGPGLYCSQNICKNILELNDESILNPCHVELAKYNKRRADGELFLTEQPPNCDQNGFYEPYKCKQSETCYCAARDGNRIPGEVPYTSSAQFVLKCECSRKFYEAGKLLKLNLQPSQYFRCEDTGDYDPLQCIGNTCLCVNFIDGTPNSSPVKLANITNLPCYDPKIHNPTFYNPCASRYLQLLQEVKELEKKYDLVFEFRYPNCDLNGNYAPVQKDYKNGKVFCANTDGTQLKKYSVDLKDAENMNCNCARAELIFSDPTNPERSTCAPNGNYEEIQCRRGYCYCVDENGVQIDKEVPIDDKDTLNCASIQ